MTPPQHPGPPDWRGRGTPPVDPATQRLPSAPRVEPPTDQLRAQNQPPRIRRAPSPADARPTQVIPPVPGTPQPPDGVRAPRRRNRMSIALIAVIALALLAGGLAGGELYARHRADTILVEVAECVVDDGASVSFGVNPPFLWQYATGDYTNISVTTDGNRVQSANGMTAELTLADVRLQESGDSKGHDRVARRDAALDVGRNQGHRRRKPAWGRQSHHRSPHRPRRGHSDPGRRRQPRHRQTRRHRR